MIAAMSAVHNQKVTISDAATKYSVPRKTLDDRIRERVEYGSRPGPSTVLTKEEEDGLASYLAYMAQRGFPLTQTLSKAFAWPIAVQSGKDDCFGKEGPSEYLWGVFSIDILS